MSTLLMSKDYLKYGLTGNPSVWRDRAVTLAGGALATHAIKGSYLEGTAAVLLKTTDSVELDIQLSMDGDNFYTPYDTEGNTIESIATAVAADRWIQFGVPAAPFFRFLLTPNADATTSLIFAAKESI